MKEKPARKVNEPFFDKGEWWIIDEDGDKVRHNHTIAGDKIVVKTGATSAPNQVEPTIKRQPSEPFEENGELWYFDEDGDKVRYGRTDSTRVKNEPFFDKGEWWIIDEDGDKIRYRG